MADNVTADPGSGGAVFGADEIGGAYYPRTKLIHGADGVNAGDVSAANPLPVYLATVGNTQPVSVSGVSTAANQATQITSLASIDGKITAVNTGAVVVSSSALPSGAATSAKQDTGNTSLASLDGKVTAVNTGAVVVASSALPSGASTSAKQPALGTAGTASADVVSVQGIASMTPLLVTATGSGSFTVAQATAANLNATVVGTGTFVVQATCTNTGTFATQVTSVPADPFGANADAASATGSISAKLRFIAGTGIPITGTVAVTQSGTWTVQPGNTANSTAWLVTGTGGTFPVTGTFWQATQPVSLASVPSHAVTNAGTFPVQVDGAALTSLQLIDDVVFAEDAGHTTGDKGIMALTVRQNTAAALSNTDADYQPLITDTNGRLHVIEPSAAAALTALQLIDDPVFTDDAAFTPGASKVMVAGFEADESSTDSVDEGDAGAARMTLDRKVIVTPQPHTQGGLSIFRSIDLDEGTLEVVKNAPGQVYAVWVTNTSTGTRFVKFYDATSGTLGTGTPVITIGIPGNSSDDVSGMLGAGGMGIAFATGICVGAGTGVADNDTGAPGGNDVIINVFYK